MKNLITIAGALICETIYHSLPLYCPHKAHLQGCGKCQMYVSLCEASNVTAP